MSMKGLTKWLLAVGVMGGWSLSETRAITIDGSLDADYGAPLAVQTVQTQFGNANPAGGNLGGSELDAAYAKIVDGRLFVLLAGNHEPNFNKLSVFIDSKAGGENEMTGTAQYDFFDEGAQSWISENFLGMTFDEGFTADYHLFSRAGGGTAPYEVDFVDLGGGTQAKVNNSGSKSVAMVDNRAVGVVPAGAAGADRPNSAGPALSEDLHFAIDNNNSAGISGGSEAADAEAAKGVTTGLEFSIALSDLGNPAAGSAIKLSAMINNSNYNFLSNQLLGGLVAPRGNLGGDGNGGFNGGLSGINLAALPGDQFFTIVVPQVNPLSCDLNGDNAVDAADAGIMFSDWGPTTGSPADKNNDGFVDAADAGIMFGEWTGDSGPVSVPEPVGLGWATAAIIVLACRKGNGTC